jgi:hypothetical protein
MNVSEIGVIVAIILGLINLGYMIMNNRGKDVWQLSDRLNKLDQTRTSFRETLFQQVETKCDEAVSRFAETLKANAEHVRLLELELYKNFVRIDTFRENMTALTANMSERLNRIDKRLDAIEDLLRHQPRP